MSVTLKSRDKKIWKFARYSWFKLNWWILKLQIMSSIDWAADFFSDFYLTCQFCSVCRCFCYFQLLREVKKIVGQLEKQLKFTISLWRCCSSRIFQFNDHFSAFFFLLTRGWTSNFSVSLSKTSVTDINFRSIFTSCRPND